jgi:hypothetical protein
VYGAGETSAKPDLVEISLRSVAAAELTADAIVKYRDARRRTLEAFEKLNLDVEIEELGVTLSNKTAAEAMQMAMRGMASAGDTGKNKVEIASLLVVRLAGIRKREAEDVMETIGRLLDAAKDAGSSIGPTDAEINMAWRYGQLAQGGLVRFVVRDLDNLREDAYRAAVADARKRAERLAMLNGVTLGEVVSVQEIQVSGDEAATVVQPYASAAPVPTKQQARIVSETFAEVPFRVKLLVRFDIKSGGRTETAKKEIGR